ncbi:MAG: threonine synthase [Chitinophagaceae bacterium]|nr:threonine synthase [Chitinophagaceae bacterium]
MQYYSLNNQSPPVSFREATIKGQASDKGLYFPTSIPKLDRDLIDNLSNTPDAEIAYRVIKPYVGDTIVDAELYRIAAESIDFPIPLVKVTDRASSLELFHGPTLAFKDVGARFMSRCLGQFVKSGDKKLTVLVATSGDTGGAVANGFFDIPGINVVILYPSGKVSSVQEKQLTTLGKNIHAIEVNGTFDQCQQLVKRAFADTKLNDAIFLTSANSINVARWLPQQFYYFFALKQWNDQTTMPIVSVPSGNFGNICAGILARASGLPIKHFIASCNANDTVPRFLSTGIYNPVESVSTLSNAMDVAEPSNFIRILEIYHQQLDDLKEVVSSYSFSDQETIHMIQRLFSEYNYLADPHGAIGYLGLEKWLADHPTDKGIFLETAHPVKFPDAIKRAINQDVPIPESLNGLLLADKESIKMEPDYNELSSHLQHLAK